MVTARRLGAAVFTVALALAFAGAAHGDSTSVHIREIQPSAFPTVGVTVSLPGNVSASSIAIRENGSPVEILSVRPLVQSGRTIDVVLAIDTSQSVAGDPLAESVAAAIGLVRAVPPNVSIGVVTFSDQARLLSPITDDRTSLIRALSSISQTQTGTALYDAVDAAARLFSGSAQRNLILLTDGTDVGSSVDLDAATAAAKQASVTVFSVGLAGSRTNFPALQRLASATRGTFGLATPETLGNLYAQLGRQLSDQYLVQYRSESANGAQVTITVLTPAGSDSSTALMPRAVSVGKAAPSRPLLHGALGLLVVLALTFLAAFVVGSWFFASTARARRDRELARRMLARPVADADLPARPDTGAKVWIPEPLAQVGELVAEVGGFKASLDRKLERAGLPMTPGEMVTATVFAGLGGLLLAGFVFRNILAALVVGGIAAWVPHAILSRKMKKRVGLLHDQLPDVLMILASSMRAGHSFLQALDTVSKEIGEPSAHEFARVVTEVRLGRPFDQALTALSERVGTEEFQWAVLAVNVQREVGGNLAEILDTLADTVREREQVRRQVSVLSAEGRMSVKILILMPFLLTAYLFWINPSYMKLLWTTRVGLGMLIGGLILMAIGAVWSRKVVRFDV